MLAVYLLGGWRPVSGRQLFRRWGLALVALLVFGFYALVSVIGRYVGAFVILFWAEALANMALPDGPDSRRLVSRLGFLMTLFLLLSILIFNLRGWQDLTSAPAQAPAGVVAGPPAWPGEVAEALYDLGVGPGSHVAVVGYGFDAFWARLARVKIVAEMLDVEAGAFFYGSPEEQAAILAAFAGTSARAIVAENVPAEATLNGWRQVGDSNYYIYLLAP